MTIYDEQIIPTPTESPNERLMVSGVWIRESDGFLKRGKNESDRMSNQIPSNYRGSGGRRLVAFTSLVGIVVSLVIWIGSCFWHPTELNLKFWSVSFSPDGSSVVTGGGENASSPPPPGELVFWKIGARHGRSVEERASVRSVAWSSDGKFVAIGDFSGVTKLVIPETGKTLRAFSPPANQVNTVAVSKDCNLVAAGTFEGTIDLWDNSGKEQHLFLIPSDKILDIAFSPNGLSMVATGRSGNAYLLDLVGYGELLKFQAYKGSAKSNPTAECTAFSPDGVSFATGSLTTLRIWETKTGMLLQDVPCTANVNNIAFAPSGDTVATVHADGGLALWNSRTGQQLRSVQAHPNEAFGLSFSPDGRRIATVSRNDFTIKIWDANSLKLTASLCRSNSK
jgi:WD40 repeat protein